MNVHLALGASHTRRSSSRRKMATGRKQGRVETSITSPGTRPLLNTVEPSWRRSPLAENLRSVCQLTPRWSPTALKIQAMGLSGRIRKKSTLSSGLAKRYEVEGQP